MSHTKLFGVGILLITAGALVLPGRANAIISTYAQLDASGIMKGSPSDMSPQPTINSGSIGNIYLLGEPAYITFTIRDPQASNVAKTPWVICLDPYSPYSTEKFDCRTSMQKYFFTDTDRDILFRRPFPHLHTPDGLHLYDLAERLSASRDRARRSIARAEWYTGEK
ncbi:hypothetical protein COU19_01420 [Candidatus Kaiserbacteria bacterium CG10_big_fil_rev_8_21_14_0_10_56_12]|uniref:Uncharacterized protein n=1 Tax=Candidatus Kaiserbacteria bacterium CG10_big_fil_rev_8_21_14_0_10_56_12 TaxID=1974611 RepID=A0A2H0UA14_9BACT|nr:MAG: hypothetical protein COU19_01420 [Candidatus Kaiserbacteria bacterium CG10_big_fil_rev_8_21_14_0_10_56_12]